MANPVDIRPDHLEIVQGILREHLPVGVKVWVFGSRANWTTKDSSDLDLALEGENALSHKLLGVLKDAFEDSTLPYTVDVVDLHRISGSFRPIVESQRVPLPQEGNDTVQPMPNRWCDATLGELGEVDRKATDPDTASGMRQSCMGVHIPLYRQVISSGFWRANRRRIPRLTVKLGCPRAEYLPAGDDGHYHSGKHR